MFETIENFFYREILDFAPEILYRSLVNVLPPILPPKLILTFFEIMRLLLLERE